MKNLLWKGWLLLGAAVAIVGCKDDEPLEKMELLPPTVEVVENEAALGTVSFTVEASGAERCAYLFDKRSKIGDTEPDAETILKDGEPVDIGDNSPIVKTIDPGTEYTVFVAAGNVAGYSKVARLDLNARNLVDLAVSEITRSSFKFTIKVEAEGGYKYVTMPAPYLQQVYDVQEAVTESEKEMAAMRYLAWYGFRDAGTKEFVHTDGETFVDYDGESEYLRELIAGMEYAVLAVGYDDTDHFAGKVAIETFRMAESGVPTGNVQFEVVGTPGIISATTLCTPDENVLYYKTLVMPKANRDKYIAERGQEMYRYLVSNSETHLTGVEEQLWKNLEANTTYSVSLLIVDKDHNVKWEDHEFTTRVADEQSAEIELSGSIGDPSGWGDDWNYVSFRVKSDAIVLPSRSFFGYTSAVTRLMTREGLTLEEIATIYGESLSQWKVDGINSQEGTSISYSELKPDVSYTFIVALTNANGEVVVKSMELKTAKRVVSPLSQSPLFEELAGTWAVSVPIQEWDSEAGEYKNYMYNFDVEIGNDNEFGELCRSYNWLMCKGWAGLRYQGPDDLRNDPAYDGYYEDIPENIFYNFGPKWFLEIDADGQVCVPTNNTIVPSLMSYEPGAPGARLAAVSTYVGSESLPVEVSADKNTLTIKPNTSGYMPSYLMLVDEGSYGAPLAKTCGDIVMTRK